MLWNQYKVVIVSLSPEEAKNFSVAKASKKHLLQREQEIFLPERALGAS